MASRRVNWFEREGFIALSPRNRSVDYRAGRPSGRDYSLETSLYACSPRLSQARDISPDTTPQPQTPVG